MLRRCACALAIAVLPALSACSGPKLEPGAGLQIVRDLPSASVLNADDVFSEQFVEATYEVVAGKNKGEARTFRRRAADQHGATFAEEIVGSRTEFLRRDAQGNIVMTAVIDEQNDALSLFDPPIVVMPAELHRGKPFESRSAMRVVDVRNPSKEKERGTAVRTIEYIGDRLLQAPFGKVATYQLNVTFIADLRLANAETQTTLYVAPEYGVVADQSSEKVTLFGALSSEEGTVAVLTSEPK
jgi:hypothetical protein